MPGTSTTLSIVLKLVDEASAAMVGVGASMKTIGASMTSAGHTLTQDLTLPIALIGGISLKMSTDFQSAMTLVQTQAGASAAEVKTMSQAILDMSAGGAEQTPIQLAQALFHLESAGLRGSDALKALKASSDLAAVGQTGLEGVTNALVGAYNSGITGASDFQTTVASLNAIVGAGNMRMGDMVAALSTGILPAARSVGISLNDVGAAIALMTSNGIPAEDAATRLRMTLSLMEAPTTKAVKALSEIGITSNQLADDMRSKGLTFAIQDLENHLVNSGLTATEQAQVISHAFGGGRTSSAILTLTQNAKELGVTFQRVNDGMSSFSADVQSQSETSASKFAEGMSKMQDASIKFGDAIRGPAGTAMSILAGAILSISDGFSKLPQSVQTGIVVFLGLLAIIGPILLILGGLFNAIGTLITVFTAIAPIVVGAATAIGIMGFVIIGLVAIIAASAYYIISHWHDVLADAQMVSGLIESYWNDAVAHIQLAIQKFSDGWKAIWKAISDTAMGVINAIIAAIDTLVSKLSNALSMLAKSAGSAVGGAANAVGGVVGGAIHAFASGGIVTGPTLALVGEAGPEAIIPLSAFSGGSSLGGGGFSSGGGVTVNLNGGMFLDQNSARLIANQIAKTVQQQLKLRAI